MNIKTFYLLILFGLSLSLNACIDPYDANLDYSSKILVVQGLVTNDTKTPDTIRIQYSAYLGDGVVLNSPITGTQVSIFSVSEGVETKLLQVGVSGGFLDRKSVV